jgi:hypothetical protein
MKRGPRGDLARVLAWAFLLAWPLAALLVWLTEPWRNPAGATGSTFVSIGCLALGLACGLSWGRAWGARVAERWAVAQAQAEHARRGTEVWRMLKRLDSLSAVEDGWFNGEGLVPTPEATALARDLLPRLLRTAPEVPRPRLYPTPEGGVQAEWGAHGWAVDLTFEPCGTEVSIGATRVDEAREGGRS